MRLWQYPESVRETFSAFFSRFQHIQIVVIDPKVFFKTIDFDELTKNFGAERVERDYRTLCELDLAMAINLSRDTGVERKIVACDDAPR
jgi:hypothetical protein